MWSSCVSDASRSAALFRKPGNQYAATIQGVKLFCCCYPCALNEEPGTEDRHPAAFAGSLKAAGWIFPFEHLLKQPLPMEQHLANYRNETDLQVSNQGDMIDQSILLWNVTHHVNLKHKTEHSETRIDYLDFACGTGRIISFVEPKVDSATGPRGAGLLALPATRGPVAKPC